MTRLCTLSPSRPASGPSLMRKVTERVGGSIGFDGQRLVDRGDGQRIGDGRGLEAGDGDDVARFGQIDRHALEAAEGEDLRDAALLDFLALAATANGSDRPTLTVPEVMRPVRTRPRNGLRSMVVTSIRNGPSSTFGGFTYSTTLSSSGAEVVLGAFGLVAHPALLGGAVEHREIELVGLCVERDEEIEDLLQHFEVALVGPVDLVDRDDRAEALGQRLAEHELGLRHRAFGGIDEDHDAVDHREDALDLAAEIGVAGGIDDVDARVLPDQRGDLGEDGDAALALEIVAESMARSSTRWFSRNEPDCLSSTSISVVLPWSTWAIIAILRKGMGRRRQVRGNAACPYRRAVTAARHAAA